MGGVGAVPLAALAEETQGECAAARGYCTRARPQCTRLLREPGSLRAPRGLRYEGGGGAVHALECLNPPRLCVAHAQACARADMGPGRLQRLRLPGPRRVQGCYAAVLARAGTHPPWAYAPLSLSLPSSKAQCCATTIPAGCAPARCLRPDRPRCEGWAQGLRLPLLRCPSPPPRRQSWLRARRRPGRP